MLCAFTTLGFPNLKATRKLILEFDKIGVDIVELGFPFSDPMADGPTIQYSSEYALKRGVCFEDSFKVVREIRDQGCRIPIIFFSYFNPIFHYGIKKFAGVAVRSGFDGVIIPDLIPEEEKGFQAICRREGLSPIFLIAPTTPSERAFKIAARSRGFIYFVSLRGVTGARKSTPKDIRALVQAVKRKVKTPVLVGFGVSSPGQAAELSRFSDGVIVGSALIDKIRSSNFRITSAVSYMKQMVNSLRSVR